MSKRSISQETTTESGTSSLSSSGKGRGIRFALTAGLVLVLLTGLGAGGLFFWAQKTYRQPGPLTAETSVIIKPGSGLQHIAGTLAEQGIISHPEVFIAMIRYTGQHTQLTAGEYRFPPQISQAEIARMLIEHKVMNHFITIPEGLATREIIALIEGEDGLTGDLPLSLAEGSLLPETYQFVRGETRRSLLQRMQEAMQQEVQALWAARDASIPINTPEEAIVLASIIEKETGVSGERARIAGVFVNRLRKGMRLQSDPTVIYALTEGKSDIGRALTRKDWKIDHPYNTYRNNGLPPGPIAHPGREALKAALNPAVTKDLYFVADGTGGHAFAETLAQHNRNVAKWRKIRDQ